MKNKRTLITLAGILVLLAGSALVYVTLKNNTPSDPVASSQPLDHHELAEIRATLAQKLEDNDPKASLDYLRRLVDDNDSLARECHPLLHDLGRAAYEKYDNFEKAISYQDGFCNSGYTHGAIEAHFIASEDIAKTVQSTCKANGEKISFELWQCYHGIGHGVMYATVKDLPRSLELCEILPSDFARNSCANGAFMERFIVVSHSGETAKNASEIVTSLCEQQDENDKADCYFYSPTAYLQRHTNDYTGAFDECQTAEEAYISSCISGVGGQAMKENVSRPEVSRDICRKAPSRYINSCIGGAISLLINHYASTTPAEPHCSSTFSQYESLCMKKMSAWNTYYRP